MNRKILSLLNSHFRAKRKYSFHEEDDLPLVIWSRGEPQVFCDVSQRPFPLKAAPTPNITRSRLQRLLRASERRLSVIRWELTAQYHALFWEYFWGVKRGPKKRLVYPQMCSIVWASDGLWGCWLPSGDHDFYDTLVIDPKWYILLHRGHTKPQKPKKKPTRAEIALAKIEEYNRFQKGLEI